MYICICRALNERKVHEATEAGAQNPSQVFRHHGEKPQCGKCSRHMRSVIEQKKEALVRAAE